MKQSSRDTKKDFNDHAFALQYIKHHRKMAENFGKKAARRLSEHGVTKGTVLDMGCGFGLTDIVLAQNIPDINIVGIDLSDHLLRHAAQCLEESGLQQKIRFEKADVEKLPFDDDTFDAVLNINMVHLVDSPVKMLDEIERVLVPEGYLFIVDIRRSLIGLFEREFRSALSIDEAEALFAKTRIRDGHFSKNLLYWEFASGSVTSESSERVDLLDENCVH